MVVLLISMAVTAIWMGAMLPAWRQQVIREKEAELIFRGEQYARAIYLYRQKNGQTSPPSIDLLVSQRYLRKKYLDPISGEEFLPIGAQSAQGTTGQTGQRAGGPSGLTAGPISLTGVRSTSNDTSIVVYLGQQTYSQFPFDWTYEAQRSGAVAPQAPGGGRGDGGGDGRGGRGGRGPTVLEGGQQSSFGAPVGRGGGGRGRGGAAPGPTQPGGGRLGPGRGGP
jgi:type II secretory pathway pseudopilin PulG